MFTIDENVIKLTRGDTAYINIKVINSYGDNVEFVDGDVLTLTIRRSTRSPNIVLQKKFVASKLIIEPSDTQNLQFGQYVYDVELRRADGYVDTIIPPHSFTLMEEVTY